MLVIERAKGEWITIGLEIKIKVHTIGWNKVRLVIDAPRELKILRSDAKFEESARDGQAVLSD